MQVGVRLVFFRYFFAGSGWFSFGTRVRIGSFGIGFGLAWIFFQIRVT